MVWEDYLACVLWRIRKIKRGFEGEGGGSEIFFAGLGEVDGGFEYDSAVGFASYNVLGISSSNRYRKS